MASASRRRTCVVVAGAVSITIVGSPATRVAAALATKRRIWAALAASITVTHHAEPMLPDFSAAFLFVAAISFMAPVLATRLDKDAGAELSGHRDRPVATKVAR